ncbi:polysaccharide deacetylase family protein [Paenibacillus taichungensis]|uniref:polysaccharide deacetylase family protein n=1 Tax=Paenibacillus taichungensis TaxID=484184 RepID=UPI0038CF46E3
MRRRSFSKVKKRDRIRFGRIVTLITLMTLFVIGLLFIYAGLTDGINRYIAAAPLPAITESAQLSKMEVNSDIKEEPTRFQGQVRKVAYITFDDGPSDYTDSILDILREYDVKATFFMIGQHLNQHKDAVKRLVEEGSYPGLHSISHDYNTLYKSGSSKSFIEEFTKEQEMVKDIVGFTPMLIRAPYGSSPQIDEAFRGDIAAAGFKMWDWTIDSLDWNLPGQPNKVVEQVKSSLRWDKEVILLHEREQTVQALPRILDLLKEKGYQIEAYDPNGHFSANFGHDQRL